MHSAASAKVSLEVCSTVFTVLVTAPEGLDCPKFCRSCLDITSCGPGGFGYSLWTSSVAQRRIHDPGNHSPFSLLLNSKAPVL